jgi:hypothetical protein
LNRSSSASTQLQSLSQLSPTRLHAYPQGTFSVFNKQDNQFLMLFSV